MHKHFHKQTKTELIKKINFALNINNDSCTTSELNGYTRRELKGISKLYRPRYKNINIRCNGMYRCKY